MKLPRDLYGRDLVQVLCNRWAYAKVNQVGSHIILQTETPRHHRVSIPDHRPLRIGTLNAILREVAAAKGVTREDIIAARSLLFLPLKPTAAAIGNECAKIFVRELSRLAFNPGSSATK